MGFTTLFGIHEQALQIHNKRLSVLGQNIANVDTPHYKSRDIDFKSALNQVQSPNQNLALKTADAGHLQPLNQVGNTKLTYRTPSAESHDGNTVELQKEQAAFAESSIRYRYSLDRISSSIRNLRSAMRLTG